MAFSLFSCYAFPMQITVDISDELAARIQALGLTPEGYVRTLIDDAARGDSHTMQTKRGRMDMQAFFEAMAAHSDKIPVLPEEATTREGIYQDHD
jgi:hypothetical protein